MVRMSEAHAFCLKLVFRSLLYPHHQIAISSFIPGFYRKNVQVVFCVPGYLFRTGPAELPSY